MERLSGLLLVSTPCTPDQDANGLRESCALQLGHRVKDLGAAEPCQPSFPVEQHCCGSDAYVVCVEEARVSSLRPGDIILRHEVTKLILRKPPGRVRRNADKAKGVAAVRFVQPI